MSINACIKKLLREPLLHFFAIGASLFALYAWQAGDALLAPDDIIVDAERVDALTTQFQRVWKRSPSPDEFQNLVNAWVREEIFYREGLALGLDRNDSVLRQRVARQMEYIAEDLIEPSSSPVELEEWFAKNAEDYRIDPYFSFRQVYINPSARGAEFETQVEGVKQALARGEKPDGDSTLLPTALDNASSADVSRVFGEAFTESLQALNVGEWVGPVASGYGLHFVYIDAKQASRLPELDEVRDGVERDYLVDRQQMLKDAIYETLQQRYNIVYEDKLTLAAGDEERE